MNFFDVDVRQRDDGMFAHRPGAALPLSTARLHGARGSAIVGIRPEEVLLAPEAEGSSMPAVVDVIETLGAEQYVFLSLADGAQIVSRVPEISRYARDKIRRDLRTRPDPSVRTRIEQELTRARGAARVGILTARPALALLLFYRYSTLF